jgi:dynein heavy chain
MCPEVLKLSSEVSECKPLRAGVDPMYQFSLDAYNEIFNQSIAKSPKSDNLSERITHLNDYHTYSAGAYTRPLFSST